MNLFPLPRVVCARCQASWRVSETETAPTCPSCGGRDVRLAPQRFNLRTLALLGAVTLLLAIVISGSAARSAGRGGAAPVPSVEPVPGAAAEEPAPLTPARAGGVPCGFCNGDGRIDERDRYRTLPPFTSAPLGPCPYCTGKGGLGR